MSMHRYVRPVNSVLPSAQRHVSGPGGAAITKHNNWLPEVYAGPADRIQRYSMYEHMGHDHEISAALDTMADFATEADDVSGYPLVIKYNSEPTDAEIQILEETLGQWCRLNELNRRLWGMFRSTMQYGDQVFIRDPQTYKLYWVDISKVQEVSVNEGTGKTITTYFIRDIDLNAMNLVATNQLDKQSNQAFGAATNTLINPIINARNYAKTGISGMRASEQSVTNVDAAHIVHLSLTEGMDSAWPFGKSILEKIHKVFKQKELLEDAILIYRIHRAPERRIFSIDIGNIPPTKAQPYLERVKYEVNQKRIPSRNGAGGSVVDSTYNPMSSLEDYYFAVGSDGRGSKVEVLPGGENLGCFSMDTKVALVDGTSRSIADIASDIAAGKKLYTYSSHPVTGKVVTGKISWAGVTRTSANVIKLTLSNGKTITCTEDHKFPLIGRGFYEAKDIEVGTVLSKFETKDIEMFGENFKMVFDSSQGTFVSQMHMDNGIEDYKEILNIHAEALISDPANADKLGEAYDLELYKGSSYRYSARMLKMLSKTYLESGITSATEFSKKMAANRKFIRELRDLNPESKSALRAPFDEKSLMAFLNAFGFTWASFKAYFVKVDNSKFANDILAMIEPYITQTEVMRRMGDAGHKVSHLHLLEAGIKKCGLVDFETVKAYALSELVRVTSVEKLDETMDVGTLTIDTDEEFHDYHTYALDAGVFVKNSIDDLKYFNNKMMRALGVPSSYLPTGPDDGTSAVTDGRVGSAFIQEFRFSKVISRYQNLIIKPLDREFKLFLKYRGISIDSSLFNLEFTPPQSFSEYRQLELDSAKINTFTALTEIPYVSKRFILQRYLGWSKAELSENERMWREERSRLTKSFNTDGTPMGGGGISTGAGLSDIGITTSGIDSMTDGGVDGMDDGLGDSEPGLGDTSNDSIMN